MPPPSGTAADSQKRERPSENPRCDLLAHARRGSWKGSWPVQLNAIDTHRPRNVLELLLTGIRESDVQLVPYLLICSIRDAYAAGLRNTFEARRDIDAVAEQVSTFGDDVAEID
jgi:hypothetical protein